MGEVQASIVPCMHVCNTCMHILQHIHVMCVAYVELHA